LAQARAQKNEGALRCPSHLFFLESTMDKIDYETYDTMEQENSDSPAKKESKAAETSSKPRAAVAVVVVSLMILGLTNVVLNIYTLTTGHSSKDVEREVNLAEPGCNDTENESESERLWNTIYEVEEELNLTKSNLLTTLPTLPREWMVEFLFKPTNYDNPGWTSIFRMTIGGDRENLGDRNPAVFFHPSQGLMIVNSLNDNNNDYIDLPAPTIDTWTKIRMSQEIENGKTKVKVFINDEEVLSAVNSKPTSFENMKVYASDTWYPAQPGSIKNLSINFIEE